MIVLCLATIAMQAAGRTPTLRGRVYPTTEGAEKEDAQANVFTGAASLAFVTDVIQSG